MTGGRIEVEDALPEHFDLIVRNFKKSLPSLSFFSHKAETVISIRQLDNILADPDVHTLADVLEKVETRKNNL